MRAVVVERLRGRAAQLGKVMDERSITLTCDLKAGSEQATMRTTDLSHAYIDENRRTS